jgi:hypothetical protein
MAIAASGGMVPSGTVRLRERWEIFYNTPLPELSSATAAAFAVQDHRSVDMSLFALVPDPKLAVRGAALNLVKMAKNPHVMTPITFGPVDWPPAKRRCLAIVFERPIGGRLLNSHDQIIAPWVEQDIVERVLAGLLPGLRALSIEGIAHRGIRPTNIFFRDAARCHATLGDCVTHPPAAHQPVAYETIESGMAMRSARGNGTIADDLYALGVLCLYLSIGQPPGQGYTDEGLIDEKIKRGSFNTLAGDARLSAAMTELCRGLLIDDESERWTLPELEHWLHGRRLTPKVTSPAARAARPFEINGEACLTARMLGRALVRAGDQAIHAVRSHGLEVWLQRSLGDKAMCDGVAHALADGDSPVSSNIGQDARLVARVAVALDPRAPIRYRSLSFTLDGFGNALAEAILSGGDVKLLMEALLSRLPQFWCHRQDPSHPEHQASIREFDRLRRMVEDLRAGFGMERLVYDLNPALHCLSPFVEESFIHSLSDLLPALELAAADGRIQAHPVDRYIASFVADRSKSFDDTILTAIGSADPSIRVAGMLHLLGQLQLQYGPVSLPALSGVFGRQAQVLIIRFRNRRTRDRLESELATVLRAGSLVQLLQFLDNTQERQTDSALFARARANFALAGQGINRCENDRLRIPEEAAATASTIAAGVSMLIGIFAVVASFLAFGHL